jgi:hypothetical protein
MFGNESSVGIPMFESGWRTAENVSYCCCLLLLLFRAEVDTKHKMMN